MPTDDLRFADRLVLGVLAERPAHGFAVAKVLARDADVGRVWTVRRPLVYRSLDMLVATGLAEPARREAGDAGPDRVVLRVTRRGRAEVRRWLDEPVPRLRDLRAELVAKLVLHRRAGTDPATLVAAQRAVLESQLAALPASDDPADLWRRHAAEAALAYLADLPAR